MEVKEVKEVNEVKNRKVLIGPVKDYKDLLVYRQAYKLALQTSKLKKALPREEQHELGKQLRRCARSVPRMWSRAGRSEIRRLILSDTW
jgi:hypothetical protein